MDRRKFLLGSAFTAAAFSEPALFALTVPPAENTARVSGRRIGRPDVEIITENTAHLRRLDFRYGSGRIREQVVQLLHREANTVLPGTYSEKVGKALLSAIAQASRLAGSMTADVGRHSLAQRYYFQTLNLAMSAGDRPFAANMLSDMSRLALHIGQNVVAKHDRLRHARQAWFGFYTEAELAADLGRCLRDVGEPEQGTRLITQAMDSYEPWRVRSRCFVQTDLATAHLVSRDFEHAAAFGRDAVRTAAQVPSTRTLDRLRTLQRQVRPLRASSPHLSELDERITDPLTRSSARRDEDTTT
jgi:hypothetical protein